MSDYLDVNMWCLMVSWPSSEHDSMDEGKKVHEELCKHSPTAITMMKFRCIQDCE